jgi:3-deoxy-D-arabino-heptulosonate 7-phosphate (DAHP) synthase
MCSLCGKYDCNDRRFYLTEDEWVCVECNHECVRSFIRQRDLLIKILKDVHSGKESLPGAILKSIFEGIKDDDFLRRRVLGGMG